MSYEIKVEDAHTNALLAFETTMSPPRTTASAVATLAVCDTAFFHSKPLTSRQRNKDGEKKRKVEKVIFVCKSSIVCLKIM